MSEFDDFIRGIGSDIKIAAEKVGKKADFYVVDIGDGAHAL